MVIDAKHKVFATVVWVLYVVMTRVGKCVILFERQIDIKFYAVSSLTSCPPDWHEFNDSCYYLNLQKNSTNDASCFSMYQSRLLIIDNEDKWAFINSTFSPLGISLISVSENIKL